MLQQQTEQPYKHDQVYSNNPPLKREPVSSYDVGFVMPDIVDLSKFTVDPRYEVPAGQPEFPLKLMRDRDGNEIFLILGKLPIPRPEKGFFPPELEKLITSIEDMEKQVMFDQALVSLLLKIGERYSQNLGVTIIGPSGISKSFGAWVMSVVAGLPYYDTTFGPSTEADEILGGPALKLKRLNGTLDYLLERPDLLRILDDPTHPNHILISETVEEINKLYRNGQNPHFYRDNPNGEFLISNLFSQMNWPTPFIEGEVGWQDSELIKAIMQGCFVVIDEKNRIQEQGVLTDIVDVTKKSFNVPGRPERVHKSPGAFVVATQNVDVYQGTFETPHHIQSRESTIVIGASTAQFYVNLYNFFIRGQNPEFVYEGKKYRGKNDIQTDFRGQLEKLPPKVLDQLIVNLAKLHMLLITMVEEKKLGKTKRKEGGNYVFDQRDIRTILGSVKHKLNRSESNQNIEDIVKEALYETYVEGVSLTDQPKVKQLIDDLPIWNIFSAHTNPSWAQMSGAPVRKEGAGYRLGDVTYSDTLEGSHPQNEISITISLNRDKDGNFTVVPPRSEHAIELLFNLIDSEDLEIHETSDTLPLLKLTSKTHFGRLFINSWHRWPTDNGNTLQTEQTQTPLEMLSKIRQRFV